jgi:hypothetical protein
MTEYSETGEKLEELKKMANIASDMQLSEKMRMQAIDVLGDMDSHEALLTLLNLAANDHLNVAERDLALKRARGIVKKGR